MSDEKKINIVGTGTRYQMKKVIKNGEDEIKSRKEIEKLELPLETFEWQQQYTIINEIYSNLKNNEVIESSSDIIKIIKNQISSKLSGYKQQDILKKVFEKEKIQLLRGPYGPYIKQGLRNFKLNKEQQEKVETLTIEEVKAIIEELKKNPPRKTARKKKA